MERKNKFITKDLPTIMKHFYTYGIFLLTIGLLINSSTSKANTVKQTPNSQSHKYSKTTITILDEDFEENSYLDWCRIAVTGDRNWEFNTFENNSYMQMSGYDPNNDTDKDYVAYLISPAIDLDQYKNEVLTFATKNGYYKGTTIEALIAPDYDGKNPQDATWQVLPCTIDETTNQSYGDSFIPSGNIDLSAYQGIANIAFRYTGNNHSLTTTYQVDDILLQGDWEDFSVTLSTNISEAPLQVAHTTPGTSGESTTYQLSYTDITQPIEITADGDFEISTDETTWAKHLEISTSMPAPQTIYVRYAPTVEHFLGVSGTITHRSQGAKTLQVTVKSEDAGATTDATTLDKTQTLDVVTWNLNWFGAPEKSSYASSFAEQLDAVSAKIMALDADIYALQEVVVDNLNGDHLTILVDKLNDLAGEKKYSATLSPRYSFDDRGPTTDYPAQRIAYIYTQATVACIADTAMFSDDYPNSSTSYIEGYQGNASSFWSGGRVPFLMQAVTNIDGISQTISVINIHAKCCSDGYERRVNDANYLLDNLQTDFANNNLIILGDYNDHLEGSISGPVSPYTEWFANENINFAPFAQANIDHIVVSNELYFETELLSNNAHIDETTISDHDPVLLRLQLSSAKKTQSITFEKPEELTYGSAPISLNAKASSSLPITFHIEQGTGKIKGNQLEITGAGKIVIIAYQSGDEKYQPATARQTVEIAKAQQEITFSLPATFDIQDTPLQLGATASSGLPVSYIIVNGEGSLSYNMFTPTVEGTVTIEAQQQGNDNYLTAVPVSQTIEITGTTGLCEELTQRINVYPNPASTFINIQLPKDGAKYTLKLLNITGKFLEQTTTTKNHQFNLEKYPNGIYFIQITSDNFTLTTKRIILSK